MDVFKTNLVVVFNLNASIALNEIDSCDLDHVMYIKNFVTVFVFLGVMKKTKMLA